jgi:hypothetical protein
MRSTFPYRQGSHVEMVRPTNWKVIGHSTTALQPVLSPRRFILLHSSHCAFFTVRKNSTRVEKMLFQFFTYFICINLKSRKSWSVGNCNIAFPRDLPCILPLLDFPDKMFYAFISSLIHYYTSHSPYLFS